MSIMFSWKALIFLRPTLIICTRRCSDPQIRNSILNIPKKFVSSKIELLNNPVSISDENLTYDPSFDTKISALDDNCDLEYIEQLCFPVGPTFNLAAYVNKSPTLKSLVDLGVKIYELEKDRSLAEYLINLDFERDIKNHLICLHDLGIESDNLGNFINYNPYIFKEDIRNINMRVEYLKWKRFSQKQIVKIINENPMILSMKIKEVDGKLGTLMKTFQLKADDVRKMLTNCPTLVNQHYLDFDVMKLSLMEDVSFTKKQTSQLVINESKILTRSRQKLVQLIDYFFEKMKCDHKLLLKFPQVLLADVRRVNERHLYLHVLKRDIYDCKHNLYIPLTAFTVSDEEFVIKYTKTSLYDFNCFLKML